MTDRFNRTPGAWGAKTREGSWDWVVYQKNNPAIEICQMFHDGTEFNERGEANAYLAAAAPELLEALESMVNCYQGYLVDDPDELIKARAAIVKARGES